MRKLTYAFALLAALLLGVQTSLADTVSPYTLDFNDAIGTSSHDFQVASGWGHIVDSYFDEDEYETVYPSYTYSAYSGRNSTGCIRVGTQTQLTAASWGTGSGTTKDLLVTPAITGTMSIYVKKYSYSSKSGIKFYKVTTDGTSYTVGDEITADEFELSSSDYTQVSIPAQPAGTYVGIWASNVYIDDFEAESAEVIPQKKLKIAYTTLLSDSYPLCNEDNKFEVKSRVTIQNNGDLDIAAGDENYSLSIVLDKDGTVLGTQPISQSLAVGETIYDTISVMVDYNDVTKSRIRYNVKENISGNTTYLSWIEPTPYTPILQLRYNGSEASAGSTFDYGKINSATSKEFTIRNKGGKYLTVTAITLPDGYQASAATPFTVPAGKDSVISVTLLAETAGTYNGEMTITADEIDPYTVNLTGIVLDPNKWYLTFEDQQIPSSAIVEDNWSIQQIGYASDTNAYALGHGSASVENKFISPLLDIAEGEAITFDAGRMSRYSYSSALNVYYSKDRLNWTLAKAIATSDLPSTAGTRGSFGKAATYTLDEVPAGQYYIAFGAKYVYIDNIYGGTIVPVDHDLLIAANKLPQTAMVNHAYTATATVLNHNTEAEEAGSYTATLYVGGEAVATAESVAIPAGQTASFSFSYTPHAVDSCQAYIVFENAADNGFRLTSDTVGVVIVEENTLKEVQSAEVRGANYYSASCGGPVIPYCKNSAVDAIYDANMLAAAGLKAGDKITKLTFKGYNIQKDLDVPNIQVYLANTTETAFGDTYEAFPDTTAMTTVYNGAYSFTKKGSESEHVVIMEFPLDEPFVYNGQSLRLFGYHENAGSYVNVALEYNNDSTGHCYHFANDSNVPTAEKMTARNHMPVIYFSVDNDAYELAGTITDGAEPVSGATVTLTSGNIIYTTVSDEQGAYAITVMQTSPKYALTVTADDYESYTAADSLSITQNDTVDITLNPLPAVVTLGEGTWAAYSCRQAVDFTQTDINAYIVTAVSGESATLKRVERIPAYTGVLLYGNGTYTLPKADSAEAPETNLLVPTAKGDYTVAADDVNKVYSFANNYFSKAAAGDVVAKSQAYLSVATADASESVYLVLPKVTFTGTVSDGTKAIAGATVILTDKSGAEVSTLTDSEGKFTQTVDQTNQKYVISATALGYDSYESDSIVALTDTVLAITLTRQPIVATVSALGWTSFSSIFPVDLTETGLTAYIVTSYADGQAIVEAAGTNAIPARTGVLLKGEAGDYTLPVADEAAALANNILGNTAEAPLEITADNAATVYAYAEVSEVAGFAPCETGYSIPMGQAYLPLTAATAAEFYALYDPTTGIGLATADGIDESKPLYNLAGQQVAKSYRGVVVQNGKKFIRK